MHVSTFTINGEPEFLYAGTVDLLCYLDGKLTIVDHKTSRFVDETEQSLDNYTGQLSAYARAIRTLEGLETEIDLQLLHLDPLSNTYKLITRKYNFNVFLDAHVRFSQTKFTPDSEIQSEDEIEKKLDEQFITKSFTCPDSKCKKQSEFPFPKQIKYLIDNQVKKIVKVAFHEKNQIPSHYAIYHIDITNLSIAKSFIYNRNLP